MDKFGTIGVSKERMKDLDFIIVPTTHLHMTGFTHRGDEDAAERAELWVKRFETLLDADMPFEKTGIAHLTCGLMYREHHLEVLSAISDEDMIRLFKRAADLGLGIELNFSALSLTDESRDIMLRPYRIAKEEGCRFYLGSDAHHPAALDRAPENFAKIAELLALDDSHKFVI
jgi:histidinol phosphatase-like PHP family hydrolase